jgi:hypothetical protein
LGNFQQEMASFAADRVVRCSQEGKQLTEEAEMYHPDMMMNIAHKREAELVREAELCGVPKAEGDSRTLPRQLLTMALICAMPLAILVVWAVVNA